MEIIVFTNGCFDIIHPGHVDLLERASLLGTKLIVGINSDTSIRRIKSGGRPFVTQNDRQAILENLRSVDEVRIFDETTPEKLIEEIKPDVLVKGGDWKTNGIVGADFVKKNGGKVVSIPLTEGHSSSAIVEKILNSTKENFLEVESDKPSGLAKKSFAEHLTVIENLLRRDIQNIERCGKMILETITNGKKILICGNGGSAADAQHIAAEFVGRFETERKALAAIALTTDTSALTALANDYDFDRVFSRQVEALAGEGDLLIALSTSGNSPNVNAAVMKARQVGCRTLGLTGSGGKKLASICDECIMVPAARTARIQEAHITIAHIWCEAVDALFAG